MFTAVTTTRIFCTDSCPAHPPRRENCIRLASVRDCLAMGCRPCKRCRPMHIDRGPEWLSGLQVLVDRQLEDSMPVDSKALRSLGLTQQHLGRWFANHFNFSFDDYCRMRSVAMDLGTHRFDSQSADWKGRKWLFESSLSKSSGSKSSTAPAEPVLLLVNRMMTPLGPMLACAGDDGVCLLEFVERRILDSQWVRVAKIYNAQFKVGVNAVLRQLHQELDEYFAGKRTAFDVPLMNRGTEFQSLVWEELVKIPVGRTWTYQQMAEYLDRPNAVRAVGRANGDNRVAILVPCHRLIGSSGSLTGYGGGLERKEWLLNHEKKMSPR